MFSYDAAFAVSESSTSLPVFSLCGIAGDLGKGGVLKGVTFLA